ncbi:MAG: endonuclease domain-containing protein [Sphingorhabdus sp.]|uniref:endonuclease domain-containing protein n=1 Tax=Sphingorhabdus sp. TaxID=1902408 RepID=UPI0038FC5F41
MITGPPRSVKLARKLRAEMSLPEVILWRELRKRPGDLKFRRQHPAGVYVLDFYCAAASLAIEVDGMAHDGHDADRRDAARTAFLKSQHVATMRVPAQAVLDSLEATVARIVEVCEERGERLRERRELTKVPLHHPSDGPPPRSGEVL